MGSDVSHTLYVEFDQQTSQNLWDHFYNVSITNAFNPALIRFNFPHDSYADDHDLTDEYVRNDPQEIWDYIGGNKDFTSWYYVCGIRGFEDGQQNVIPGLWGTTIRRDQSNDHFGSLVAYEVPIQYKPKPYQNIDAWTFIDHMLTFIMVHEFGHQLGLTSDAHTNHSPGNVFCAMYQGLYEGGRSLYENPHFCRNHVNDILNINP